MLGSRSLRGAVAALVIATVAVTPSSAAAGEGVTAPIPAPSQARGATLARIVAPATARSRPAAGRRVWGVGTATSWSGQQQVLLVLGSAEAKGRQWLRVRLPIRPVGASGWIPRDNVAVVSTPYWITIDKSARSVSVFRAGRLVRRARAVIGKPATPTPNGLAAIYEKDRQPDRHGFLGPWALPLTALSNVLRNFGGGPGRVAIHGRAGASFRDPLGSARSHGCIRIDNRPITWIANHVPTGTPVRIRD